MSLICFASPTGSAETAFTASLVANSWPEEGREKLFVEANVGGHSLRADPDAPDLETLAKALSQGKDVSDLQEYAAETMLGSTPVVVAPQGAEVARGTMLRYGRQLGYWLQGLPNIDTFADVGQLSACSPALSFAAEASTVCVVARPNMEELQAGAELLLAVAGIEGVEAGWVLIGDQPYSAKEVGVTFGFPVFSVLADSNQIAGADVRQISDCSQPSQKALLTTVASLVSELTSDFVASEMPVTETEVCSDVVPVETPMPPPPVEKNWPQPFNVSQMYKAVRPPTGEIDIPPSLFNPSGGTYPGAPNPLPALLPPARPSSELAESDQPAWPPPGALPPMPSE